METGKRSKLLQEWKEKHDPHLEDMRGFEKYVEDRLQATETARVESGKTMEKVFRVMSKITDEAHLRIDKNGIFLREVNSTHTAMGELSIPPEACEELEIDGFGSLFQIDINKFVKYFKRARAGEDIVIKRKGEKVIIEFPESNRKYSVAAKESAEPELPSPAFSGGADFEIDPGDLKSALLDAEADGNYVAFEYEDGVFEIRTLGKLEKSTSRGYGASTSPTYSFEETDSEFVKTFEVEGTGEAKSGYNLDFIKPFITQGIGNVSLRWRTGSPLEITYDFFEGFAHLKGIVAPRALEKDGIEL